MAESQYRTSGTENLRADPSVKDGAQTDSPNGSGKDMGGTANLRADPKVMQGSIKETTPTSTTDSRPAGVQHFNGGAV